MALFEESQFIKVIIQCVNWQKSINVVTQYGFHFVQHAIGSIYKSKKQLQKVTEDKEDVYNV